MPDSDGPGPLGQAAAAAALVYLGVKAWRFLAKRASPDMRDSMNNFGTTVATRMLRMNQLLNMDLASGLYSLNSLVPAVVREGWWPGFSDELTAIRDTDPSPERREKAGALLRRAEEIRLGQ